MVSAENQFLILAALKSVSLHPPLEATGFIGGLKKRVVTSTTWGNWLHDNHCSTFWQKGSWKRRNKGILLSFSYS